MSIRRRPRKLTYRDQLFYSIVDVNARLSQARTEEEREVSTKRFRTCMGSEMNTRPSSLGLTGNAKRRFAGRKGTVTAPGCKRSKSPGPLMSASWESPRR
jgi:hypothetical protein